MASSKKRAPKRKAPSETRLGRLELKFEVFETKLDTVIDGIQSMREQNAAEHAQSRAALAAQLQPIELAIRALNDRILRLEQRMDGLERRIGGLEQRMDELAHELRAVKAQLALVLTRAEYESLERRVAALEAHLGITG